MGSQPYGNLRGLSQETRVKLELFKICPILLQYSVHGGIVGSSGRHGQNKAFNNLKDQTHWMYFPYSTYWALQIAGLLTEK